MTDGTTSEFGFSCGRPEPTADVDEDGADGVETGPDNHLALVYETPAEQLSAVVPFVRRGLERGDRVMYVADTTPVADLRSAFEEAGVDVESALDSGALTFHTPIETYGPAGSFDAEEMIDYLDETMREVVSSDEYDRLRITGEMTWALSAEGDTLDRLVEYEAKVNEFYTQQPVVGLCQYDRTRFSTGLLHDVIRSHPHQVYNATVTQNFAYLPPEEFFAAEPPSDVTAAFVEAHLDRVRAHGRRQEHERTLSTLSTSSHDLLVGECDAEGVAERLTGTVARVLSPAVVAVMRYEESAGELRPASVRTGGTVDPDPLLEGSRELLWESFLAGEPSTVEAGRTPEALPSVGTRVESAVVHPLDRHGVLFVGSPRSGAFDEADVEFVRTAANAGRSALDRLERERALDRQNEELRHLDRVNRTIRRIDQALVRASSREAVETAVCERLAETDAYRFVWVGDRDSLTGRFAPRRWAGDGEAYLDEVHAPAGTPADGGDDCAPPPTPARRAFESGAVQVVPNALTTTEFPAWRHAALGAGLYAAISVPLVHNEAEFGVLSVYAGEPNAMTELERDVLTELGATVAYAIDAAETKESLHTDRLTELTLEVRDFRSRLLRLARAVDGTLAVETVNPAPDGAIRLFFTVADAPAERVRSVAEDAVYVEAVRLVSERPEGALFEAVLDVPASIPATMAEFNGSITELDATPDGVELTVELPATADVRGFVERFEDAYPETSVSAIRRVTRPLRTRETFRGELEERLTDRQMEALRLAYHGGYFEWPRDSSATDVADSMGVTQPTFNGHLRAGERKLLELLFGS